MVRARVAARRLPGRVACGCRRFGAAGGGAQRLCERAERRRDTRLAAQGPCPLRGWHARDLTHARRAQPAVALSQLHDALQFVQQLPEGAYLLRRSAASSVVECLRAVPSAHGEAACIEGVQDLVASRRDAGATDAGNLDFVPIRWQARPACRCCAPSLPRAHALTARPQAAHPGAPQIPFTHPPAGLPGLLPRRAARQQWMLAGSSPPPSAEEPARSNRRQPQAPRRANVRYCHAFAEGRVCKAGERCAFPHLTLAEVEKQASDPYLSQLREYMTAGKPAKRPRVGAR